MGEWPCPHGLRRAKLCGKGTASFARRNPIQPAGRFLVFRDFEVLRGVSPRQDTPFCRAKGSIGNLPRSTGVLPVSITARTCPDAFDRDGRATSLHTLRDGEVRQRTKARVSIRLAVGRDSHGPGGGQAGGIRRPHSRDQLPLPR